MSTIYSERDIRMMLRGYVRSFENQTIAAKSLVCDASQLSKMISGERPVSRSTLNVLGLVGETVYKDI